MKQCKKCLVIKEESENFFEFRNDTKKFRNICRKCRNSQQQEYNLLHRDEICNKLNSRPYDHQSRVRDRQRSNKYYLNNTEKVKQNVKQFKKDNPKYMSEWRKAKIQKDSGFRLRNNISSAISLALKKNNSNKKRRSCLKFLEYSIQELKNHLENQFDANMSWDNYGSYWHIDHIYPQSKLPYTSMHDDNFKKCWALSNLRPLEAKANIKKGAKIQ